MEGSSTTTEHLAETAEPSHRPDEATRNMSRKTVEARQSAVYMVTIAVSALAASGIALLLKSSLQGFVWCCREQHILESTAFLALAIMALILAALLAALIPSMIVSFAAALVITIPARWLKHGGHIYKSEAVDDGYRLAREISTLTVHRISWGTCLAVFVSGTAIAIAIETLFFA